MIEQLSRQESPVGPSRPSEREARLSALGTLLGLLHAAQDEEGGWEPIPSSPPTTESTALGLLAVSFGADDTSRLAASRARGWFRARQRPDGSWPHSDQVPHGGWATSLAVLALSRYPEENASADAGARWLLAQEGRRYGWLTKLMFLLKPERKAVQLDPDLIAWPWYPDTFSWVEPTSYCLMALKSRPFPRDRRTRARIDEAERMILDRECLGGGWNYGNSRVLDEELWPYPDTTALALIALQDHPRHAALEKSLVTLARMVEDRVSILGLSLATLAFRLHARDVTAVRSRLIARIEGNPHFDDLRSLAFAALALHSGAPPLAFPTGASGGEPSTDG